MSKIEILLFPRQDYVNITQNSLTSEKGSHMNTNAIDGTVKESYGRIYAPITCKVMSIDKNSPSSEVIYFGCDEYGNIEKKRAYYVENGQNKYVDKYMAMRCVHKYDTDMFSIGKVFKQQEYFYNQGRHSMNSADDKNMAMHYHFEVAFFDNIEDMTTNVKMTDTRPSIQGQNLIGAVKPEKYLALLEGEYTIGVGSNGLNGLRGNTLPIVKQAYDTLEPQKEPSATPTTYTTSIVENKALKTINKVNCRQVPSVNSGVHAILEANNEFDVTEITNEYIENYKWVYTQYDSGKWGWVALIDGTTELIEKVEPTPTPTPCECEELKKELEELKVNYQNLSAINSDLIAQKEHLQLQLNKNLAKVKELELAHDDVQSALTIAKKEIEDLEKEWTQ